MSWSLRQARPGDLEQIMQLEASIFRSDAWSRETMTKDLTNSRCYYLVAVSEGDDLSATSSSAEVIGYAGLFAPVGAKDADVQTIAVADGVRRKGLGRVLMQSMISEARRRGAEQVFLEVRADNPGAQRLYRTLGFEQIAVRADYYQPDGVDAIVMRLIVPEPQTTIAGANA